MQHALIHAKVSNKNLQIETSSTLHKILPLTCVTKRYHIVTSIQILPIPKVET